MTQPSLYSDDFAIDMKKGKFTASDILEQPFNDDFDFLALIPMKKKVKKSKNIGDQL